MLLTVLYICALAVDIFDIKQHFCHLVWRFGIKRFPENRSKAETGTPAGGELSFHCAETFTFILIETILTLTCKPHCCYN